MGAQNSIPTLALFISMMIFDIVTIPRLILLMSDMLFSDVHLTKRQKKSLSGIIHKKHQNQRIEAVGCVV